MNNTKSTIKGTVRKSNDNTIIVTKTVERDEVVFKKELSKVNEILDKTVFKK